MDPLESLEGPNGVPQPQFGNQSWTHWKPSKDPWGSLNHSLGTGGEVETHGGERHRYDLEIECHGAGHKGLIWRNSYRASDIELILREREGACLCL